MKKSDWPMLETLNYCPNMKPKDLSEAPTQSLQPLVSWVWASRRQTPASAPWRLGTVGTVPKQVTFRTHALKVNVATWREEQKSEHNGKTVLGN